MIRDESYAGSRSFRKTQKQVEKLMDFSFHLFIKEELQKNVLFLR